MLEEFIELAKKMGGECLSKEYHCIVTKLQWRCGVCGYGWEATPANIKSGRWCPKCAGCTKKTLEDMQEMAKKRGGECLSKAYKGAHGKLLWRCVVCSKEWSASPNNVARGTWCPRCSHKERVSIAQIHVLAKSRGGECLSTACKTVDTNKLLWKCNRCGNVWEATTDNIKQGTWCPKCAKVKKRTLEEMKAVARERDGLCLSKEYLNCWSDLLWKCNVCSNEWKATGNNVLRGTWCPYCPRPSESLCRKIFEELFGVNFPKRRPLWLKNHKTGGRMELDGYNEQLKIAFEYNGLQHYDVLDMFHRSVDDLERSVQRDILKQRLCTENAVRLIVIPPLRLKHKALPFITKKTLRQFILDRLKNAGITPPHTSSI